MIKNRIKIGNSWDKLLASEFNSKYFNNLMTFLNSEYQNKVIYPPKPMIFRALSLTPPENLKVLILGQDPYHDEGQANGLAFSVSGGIALPRSLINIYKELDNDIYNTNKSSSKKDGNLENWAKQGVLMLNTVLTVEAHKPGSHEGVGWENFTDHIINKINLMNKPVVVILWGKKAQKKICLLSNPQHLVISSAHPSPLSARRGFFGSKPFSKINQYLKDNKMPEINWNQGLDDNSAPNQLIFDI